MEHFFPACVKNIDRLIDNLDITSSYFQFVYNVVQLEKHVQLS